MAQVNLKTNFQKIPFSSEGGYVTRTVTYSKLDADTVLDRAADNSGIDRGVLAASIHAVLKTFRNFVMNGHSVEFPELGTFRFSVNAKMASSEDEAGSQCVYRRRIVYFPSKKVKKDLANVALRKLGESTSNASADDSGDSTDTDAGTGTGD